MSSLEFEHSWRCHLLVWCLCAHGPPLQEGEGGKGGLEGRAQAASEAQSPSQEYCSAELVQEGRLKLMSDYLTTMTRADKGDPMDKGQQEGAREKGTTTLHWELCMWGQVPFGEHIGAQALQRAKWCMGAFESKWGKGPLGSTEGRVPACSGPPGRG